MAQRKTSVTKIFKDTIIGKERQLTEDGLFHKLSLVTLLAWVGLGADGLSSSCYGPEQAYKALADATHTYYPLAVFIALMSALTVFIIAASYSQIIGAFPAGGGGYVVATRLLNPTLGVISGSALLIDYVLTIAISIASAVDFIFSMLPEDWLHWKLLTEIGLLLFMAVLNLRGVRESVMVLLPIFFAFLITHTFAVLYAFFTHGHEMLSLSSNTVAAVHTASAAKSGLFGVLALLIYAYSMGAGTYTGIEAVSNGLSILREPRVRTGRRTMLLMALSLAGMVAGLLVAYLLVQVDVSQTAGGAKTLNAVLMETLTKSWPHWLGSGFVQISLLSSACLLVIAAQAGFLGGPPVLAAMAMDRWMPNRFTALSDRYVTINGVLIMGGSALVVLLFTHGSVELLVVLYSINVFITFSLSQLGMVRHWWQVRHKEKWLGPLAINAVGLCLTSFILVVMIVQKFTQGGWVTMVMTGALVAFAFAVRRHYEEVRTQLKRMDFILEAALAPPQPGSREFAPASNRTAIFLVNGFNGLGLHTLFGAARLFGGGFKKIVFVSIGVVDAGNFKGADELERLRLHVSGEGQKYVDYISERGGQAEAITAIGRDVLDELENILPDLQVKYPHAVFFSGQLVFERENIITKWLHNYTAFAIQRRLFLHGLPCAIVPMRVENSPVL